MPSLCFCRRIPLLILLAGAIQAWGQTTPPSDQASASAASEITAPAASTDTDRFHGIRVEADQLRAIWEQTQAENIADVDRLLRSPRCQILRITGDIGRTKSALDQYLSVERAYWQKWADAEELRVAEQKKSIAALEQERDQTKLLLDQETQDDVELTRRKNNLEKYSFQSEDVRKDIDKLVLEIRDTEDGLKKLQGKFDDLTIQVANMEATVTEVLANIHRNLNEVERSALDRAAFYEDKLKGSQAICNLKKPSAAKSPASRQRSQP